MSHKDLTKLSIKDLEYEVGQSKQCLLEHNINSSVFGNPFASGWDNSTVVQTLSKYYDIARAGYGLLTFLDCYSIDLNQTDCRTYFDNGTSTLTNRYSLRLASHNDLDSTYMHNSTKILPAFIEAVNKQTLYNDNGEINAIPIVVYHNIDYIKNNYSIDNNWYDSTTDVNLFDSEMKYLHGNGFKVFAMSDLGYNQTTNKLYIKNDASPNLFDVR